MTDKVYIEKVDNVHVKIHAEPGIKQELSDYFTFYVPGYKFMPAYRNRMWDGKIRLLNKMTGLIYSGLLYKIVKFCKSRKYKVKVDPELIPNNEIPKDIGYQLAKEFDCLYEPRDYQNDAVYTALSENRRLLLSPTASGKSLIIYLISRYYVEKHKKKVLIIVPTTSLVSQMKTDFIEYNKNKSLDIHQIKAGADKTVKADYTISTWQSLHKMPKQFFKKYDCVFVDEAHLAKAKSITKIMEKIPHAKYRFGLTGTLDDTQTHKLVLTGLFGPVKTVIRTHELIENKTLADFKIKALVLEYTDDARKAVSKMKYQDEIDWIVRNERRNKYICDLTKHLRGNTLILFQFVEKHGDVLYKMLQEYDKPVHYVHGGVEADDREKIRAIAEKSNDINILASSGTFSTGTNIKRLDNIIFVSPSKSKIKNLQSIGRGLRKGNGSEKATLYDIVDDLQWKSTQNFAVKHFMERLRIYSNEKFEYKIYNVKLEG